MQRRRLRGHGGHKKVWRAVGVGQTHGPLELRSAGVEGGGLCWVASRPIAQREPLETGERPLLSWNAPCPKAGPEAAGCAVASAFLQANEACQRAILRLTPGPKEATEHFEQARRGAYRAMVEAGVAADAMDVHSKEVDAPAHAAAAGRVNAFHGMDDALVVFEKVSRYNHSCVPNAEYALTDSNVMKVRALRPIATGEEVCISYLGNSVLLTRSTRRRILKDRYFFECGCALCIAPKDDFTAIACTKCGGRAVPSFDCEACGAFCDESTDAVAAASAMELKVAKFAMEWEDGSPMTGHLLEVHISKLRAVMKDALDSGLRHHVAYVRSRALLLEAVVASIASLEGKRARDSAVEEAWKLYEELFAWFNEPWNMMSHCWGMYLAEPISGLEKILRDLPGKRAQSRAAQLQRLLSGK